MKQLITLSLFFISCFGFTQIVVESRTEGSICNDSKESYELGLSEVVVLEGATPLYFTLNNEGGNVVDSQRYDVPITDTRKANFITTGLEPGFYFYSIVNDNNVIVQGDLIIPVTPKLNATVNVKNANGSANGSIEIINANGGNMMTTDYTYSIDGGSNFYSLGKFSDLAAGTYNVVVKSNEITRINSRACCTYKETVKVEGVSASIEEQDLLSVKVYPNPTSNFLILPTKLVGKKFMIYDLKGRKVLDSKLKTTRLNLKRLTNGSYFLKFKNIKTIQFLKE